MGSVRTPAVAGAFYPAHPQRLATLVEELLPGDAVRRPAAAVLVPHAGYVYSGAAAARTFASVVVPQAVILLCPNHTGLTLGTFHATCARILRREAEFLPFESNFVIFDADDQLGVVKAALKDLNLDEKRYKPAGVHAVISNAKNELKLPDEFPVTNFRDEVIKRIYKRYQELLLANNALDFDDLLLWTSYLLEEKAPVRERYARRFEHVLVDEFQDTNLAQYSLLKHLASFHHNIFVVGDTDQSIYRWRGVCSRPV